MVISKQKTASRCRVDSKVCISVDKILSLAHLVADAVL